MLPPLHLLCPAFVVDASHEAIAQIQKLHAELQARLEQQTEDPVLSWLDESVVEMAFRRCDWDMAQKCRQHLEERETLIHLRNTDPLTYAHEVDIWRRIDLAIARKRLQLPGKVLEILITGGMRPGKSYSSARRLTAHFLWTQKACTFALAETVETSRKLQQQVVERFLPEAVSPKSGKKSTSKHERFKFNGGHFTNEEFSSTATVTDENGVEYRGGGDFVFKFFSQTIATFQGFELTGAWSDEMVPLPHVKAIRERMATRAGDTKHPKFLARIKDAEERLMRGEKLPLPLLGALYHGVHIISFTPYLGWNETVNYFLRGARKMEMEIAPDLVNKPGCADPRVPRFAQPLDEAKLVAYVFTSDNQMKPAYPALSAQLKDANEAEVRIKLYGDVNQAWNTQFSNFSKERHVKTWAQVPREGTIYEVVDPGDAKPWFFAWFLCDPSGRHWLLQEWPCPSIPVEGLLPGPWAVPSEGKNFNGDKGPAYKMRLNWSRARYLRLIYEMRQRLLDRFKETGAPFKGATVKTKFEWKGKEDWTLEGDFIEVESSIMDSRFAGKPTESKTGNMTTLLETMYEEENAIAFEAASGVDLRDGNTLIQTTLADEILFMPGLMIVDECENHLFMFQTFMVPEFKENTTAKDEACKEGRDTTAYYLLSGPRHVEKGKLGFHGGEYY